jgi:hypothetical protein
VAIAIVGGSVGLAATAAVSVLSNDLPDPSTLNALTFNQPTVVYDRTGTVVLGTFQQERRRVVAFDEVAIAARARQADRRARRLDARQRDRRCLDGQPHVGEDFFRVRDGDLLASAAGRHAGGFRVRVGLHVRRDLLRVDRGVRRGGDGRAARRRQQGRADRGGHHPH